MFATTAHAIKSANGFNIDAQTATIEEQLAAVEQNHMKAVKVRDQAWSDCGEAYAKSLAATESFAAQTATNPELTEWLKDQGAPTDDEEISELVKAELKVCDKGRYWSEWNACVENARNTASGNHHGSRVTPPRMDKTLTDKLTKTQAEIEAASAQGRQAGKTYVGSLKEIVTLELSMTSLQRKLGYEYYVEYPGGTFTPPIMHSCTRSGDLDGNPCDTSFLNCPVASRTPTTASR